MSIAPLRIWCNTAFPADVERALLDGLGPHRLTFAPARTANNLAAAPPDAGLLDADVAFGQPDVAGLIGGTVRWAHLTTAGYERYDRADLRDALARRGGVLSNASYVYDEPCAQHAAAMILALARQLPAAVLNQAGARGWPYLPLRAASRLLNGQRVLLLGFGAIARRLVELLTPFKVELVAIRRTPAGDEPIRVVAELDVDAELAAADHVVNVLPGGAATDGFMSAARFERMKPGATFYNIGRGTTVDQPALEAALQSGHLAAAYLDVMTPEPLPPEHPLWRVPNCHLTPHTAGGHSDESMRHVRLFLDNLARFAAGREVVGRVI